MVDTQTEIEACEFELNRIEAEKKPLLDRLDELSGETSKINHRIWELKYGLVIGCIVERRGRRYKVSAISESLGPPWVHGVRIKQDGNVGTHQFWIGSDWKVVKP